MPKFSKTSSDRLYTCDIRLVHLFNKVVEVVDCTIIEGHRGEAKQNEAYYADPQRSKVKYPNSKHNITPSLAVDAAPYYQVDKIRWNDLRGFTHFAGVVRGIAFELGVPIRWGGDWDKDFDLLDQDFHDLPHFELVL